MCDKSVPIRVVLVENGELVKMRGTWKFLGVPRVGDNMIMNTVAGRVIRVTWILGGYDPGVAEVWLKKESIAETGQELLQNEG